jgi:hypothetical protein
VSGPHGATWRTRIADNAFTYEEGDAADCQTVLDFKADDFVLTCYQRTSGGTAAGDQAVAEQFRGLFFKI